MKIWNTTSDFILLQLFNHTGAHLFLFVIVLIIAFTSLVGNDLMLFLIHQDVQLHMPMYLLLRQLSLMDMLLVSTIVPKMAADSLNGQKSISPVGCGWQIFFFITLGGAECFLLASMSYDRYVAVCHPLRYPIFISWHLCLRLTVGSWLLGATDGLMQVAVVLSFPFCGAYEINNFFHEAPTLVHLAYADTVVLEHVLYTCCVLMLLVPFSLILISCSFILAAVLQMRSREAHKKTFASCSSHLSVVGIFYRAGIFTYMQLKSYRPANSDKVVSAFYMLFTSLLHPLIYSRRNNEVKGALRKCMGQCAALSHDQDYINLSPI
ncbi:olfactory receptor 2T8-like [Lutra lutra]|uniref:olfactory receptor 2T8-like n=1 Tax=Lutra lutra TaxID=9657 RepID=UPI001FCFD7D1|nr:olfactory receptor 2T8-like [Lutra lutra]